MAFKIKKAEIKEQLTIDVEPKWTSLCNLVQSGHLEGKFLQPACKLADVVRQAQKSGKKSVTFKFDNTGENVTVETK
jgi:hypothetical protein